MKDRDLDFKSLLEVLAHFEVRYTPLPTGLAGLCDPNGRVIYILETSPPLERTEIIVHEAYHALHFIHGEPSGEGKVNRETTKTMGVLGD